jgi:hypothetical protein
MFRGAAALRHEAHLHVAHLAGVPFRGYIRRQLLINEPQHIRVVGQFGGGQTIVLGGLPLPKRWQTTEKRSSAPQFAVNKVAN